MRWIRGLFCAAALLAFLAPGAHADEYTKQTFLTFSGPVQLPGIMLPAGTYQFKLADPASGRRTLQVWDKDGNKLLTTLLTIPDQRMKPTNEPVVMFQETPSGQPQAIRAWFYPNESYGQEFVYPKDQAMKLARETHSSVLSYEGDAKDEAAYKAAKVARVDENGNLIEQTAGSTTASNAAPGTAAGAATTADNSANGVNAAPGAAPSASAPTTQAADNANTAPMPSADRSSASAAAGTSGNTTSEANRDNTRINGRTVGTSGSTAAQAPSNTAAQNTPRELPRTASSTALVQLLAGLSLAGALAIRVFRARAAESR
jgi:hypothetical protein